jgi:hypothetical protein
VVAMTAEAVFIGRLVISRRGILAK